MRRLVRGMPGMLMAAFVLFARLLAPALAMPATGADGVALAGLQAICHAGLADDGSTSPGPAPHPDHADCLLCPACHVTAQVAIPAPVPALPAPVLVALGLCAPPPPATGPPARPRTAAQPTGPPTISV